MNDTPAMPSDRDLDQLLLALGDAIDVPPMTDSAARARRRIDARGATARPHEPFTTPDQPRDERAAAFQPREILQLPLEEQDSKIREFALLAAGLAAAAILSVALAFVFGGFENEDAIVEDISTGLPEGHPLAANPYDIPGYEFAGAIGAPQVPNTPVDVVVGPDGAYYVVDMGLGRIVALDADGQVREDWGAQGFSPPLDGVTGAALGPDGELYVVGARFYELDAFGALVDDRLLPFPEIEPNSTLGGSHTGPAVDGAGNIYIGHSGDDSIFRITPDGEMITIDLGEDGLVGPVSDTDGNIFAMTYAGRIFQIHPDGQFESVTRLEDLGDVIDLAIDDEGFSILLADLEILDEMIVARVNRQGGDIDVWNTGIRVSGSIRGQISSIALIPNDALVLADPTSGHLQRFSLDGEDLGSLGQAGPGLLHYLWRIALDGDENVYALDPIGSPSIHVFGDDGSPIRRFDVIQGETPPEEQMLPLAFANPLLSAHGLAVTGDGTVITGAYRGSTIRIYDDAGEMTGSWGEFGLGDDGLFAPTAIAAVGDEALYVADDNGTIKEYTIGGEFVRVLGEFVSDRRDLWQHGEAIWAIDGTQILRYPLDGSEREVIAGSSFAEDEPSEIPGQLLSLALTPAGEILVYSVDIIPMDELGIGRPRFVPTLSMVAPNGALLWTRALDPSPNQYLDLAISDDGVIYIADSEARQILVYAPTDEDSEAEAEAERHPLDTIPYEIPGFEFVAAAGRPAVPNEPVDVAIGPDGTQFVLDMGLHRVVAFTANGELRSDWGDEGFSPRLSDLGVDGVGAGPDGQVYVALTREVLVFDASGRQVDAWSFPETANEETRIRRSQGLVVDSAGNVYVAGRGVVWRFEAGSGMATTIQIGSETDFQLAIDGQDQLYAASWPGGIYRVSTDGELAFVGRADGRADINGFAIAPDGRIIVFRSSTSAGEASTFITLDSAGAEIASWEIDRTGIFMDGFGPYWIGIDITSDGTIVLPDYLGHRISYYNPDGTLVSELRDGRSDAFGRLWRIAVDGEGNVLGYDPSVDSQVLRFGPDGELQREMPFEAELLGGFVTLFDGNGFTATEDGGFIIVNQSRSNVLIYSPDGELLQAWGEIGLSTDESGLAFPSSVAVDGQGFVYIVDEGFAGRLVDNLRKFTVGGEFVAEIGSIGFPARADLVYHDGAIWAIDDATILRFPSEGGDPQVLAGPATEDREGELPGGPLTLALDGAGNIYTYMISLDGGPDNTRGLLAKLDPNGNMLWTADLGHGALSRYVDLAIADDGTLYLSDSELRQILVYRPIDESQVVATTEPPPVYEPVGEVPDLLVVTEIADPESRPQYALVDPSTMERRDLPPGEVVGISPDGGTLLLIDQEPGEEWVRLELFAVSTETFEEVWRTDIGEENQNYPNTIFCDTAVSGDAVYVAIHDPDYRPELLEIAQVRLSDGIMQRVPGMDTDISELAAPSVEVDLFAPSLDGDLTEIGGVTYFLRAPEERRTTIGSAFSAGYDHRLRELVPLQPGERHLLPGGEGLFNIPSSGPATDPAIEYIVFEDVTSGKIELPFASVELGEETLVAYGLSHDGRRLYALSPYDAQIAIVDLESLEVASIETLSDTTLPASLPNDPDVEALRMLYAQQPLSISPDGRYIYALGPIYELNGGYTPGIWKIDTNTWTIVAEAAPGGGWSNLSLHSNYDGSRLYVSLGLQWPLPSADGEYEISSPGMLVMDTETFDDQTGLIDLEGYRIVGTLADLYRDFHGRSPAVIGVGAG